ncbi:hypothetical protein [Dyadobacter sp. 22481]|uniref:hypothetical protein n=1 Tax=Dyadobacter sp. 22481 TaxID=3453926 RepID=UPI003F83F54A
MNFDQILHEIKGIQYANIIAEYLFTRVADHTVAKFRNHVTKAKNQLDENERDFIRNIKFHVSTEAVLRKILYNIKKSDRWSNEINFQMLHESKNLTDLFIELDISLSQKKNKIDRNSPTETISSSELTYNLDRHVLLIGDPGAGKTTLMKKLYGQLLGSRASFMCPIVVKFRELNYPRVDKGTELPYGFFNILLDVLGIPLEGIQNILNQENIDIEARRQAAEDPGYVELLLEVAQVKEIHGEDSPQFKQINDTRIAIAKNLNSAKSELLSKRVKSSIQAFWYEAEAAISDFLDSVELVIILEGFDEIPDQRIKDQVQRDIQNLSSSISRSRFVITSRQNSFAAVLNNCRTFEITPLSESQIEEFTSQWIKDEAQAGEFIAMIKETPYYDTAIRPLTLAHLCAIYELRGSIPSRATYIYKLITDLLIEKWDSERLIRRKSKTEVGSKLTVDNMEMFLSELSFTLSFYLKKAEFTMSDLEESYELIRHRYLLAAGGTKYVIEEIESTNGILIRSGYDSFQFAHKSIQEYLTAKFISLSGYFPEKNVLQDLPEEVAIAVSILSRPSKFLENLIKYLKSFPFSYWLTMCGRLAVESPEFSADRSAVLFVLTIREYFHKTISTEELEALDASIHRLFKNSNISIGLKDVFSSYAMESMNDQGMIKVTSKGGKPIDSLFTSQFYMDQKLLTGSEYEKEVHSLCRLG